MVCCREVVCVSFLVGLHYGAQFVWIHGFTNHGSIRHEVGVCERIARDVLGCMGCSIAGMGIAEYVGEFQVWSW